MPGMTRRPRQLAMLPDGAVARAAADIAVGRPARRNMPLVGVVGGMGPLASTELLRAIYRDGDWTSEQDAPRVLLWSDPAVVDRTVAIASGDLRPLRHAVERSVRGLLTMGADSIVVACLTAHPVMCQLPDDLAQKCVSLVDVVFDELARTTSPHLLLCTEGTVRSGIFTRDPRWSGLVGRVFLPSVADQARLHEQIYLIKRGGDPIRAAEFLRDLLPGYGNPAFVAACTELHLVVSAIEESSLTGLLPAIDPLSVVARKIRNGEL